MRPLVNDDSGGSNVADDRATRLDLNSLTRLHVSNQAAIDHNFVCGNVAGDLSLLSDR